MCEIKPLTTVNLSSNKVSERSLYYVWEGCCSQMLHGGIGSVHWLLQWCHKEWMIIIKCNTKYSLRSSYYNVEKKSIPGFTYNQTTELIHSF